MGKVVVTMRVTEITDWGFYLECGKTVDGSAQAADYG
jgi:hypothetical protein